MMPSVACCRPPRADRAACLARWRDGAAPAAVAGMPQTCEASILFTDVRGFTSLAERCGSNEALAFLEDYLERVNRCTVRHGGTVECVAGDGAMAVFTARCAGVDHAIHAVDAALAIFEDVARWNDDRQAAGLPRVRICAGINSGQVAFGRLVPSRQINLTVVGSCVNIASRLERACRVYGASLLIGEETRRRLRRQCLVRFVDRAVLEGLNTPISIYEVLSPRTPDVAAVRRMLVHYYRGLRFYRRGLYREAVAELEAALRTCPQDGLTRLRASAYRSLVRPEGGESNAVRAIVHCSNFACLPADRA